MASSSAASKPSVGILSIGDMGMGVAKLLLAHDYEVMTVSAGRRQAGIFGLRFPLLTLLVSILKTGYEQQRSQISVRTKNW